MNEDKKKLSKEEIDQKIEDFATPALNLLTYASREVGLQEGLEEGIKNSKDFIRKNTKIMFKDLMKKSNKNFNKAKAKNILRGKSIKDILKSIKENKIKISPKNINKYFIKKPQIIKNYKKALVSSVDDVIKMKPIKALVKENIVTRAFKRTADITKNIRPKNLKSLKSLKNMKISKLTKPLKMFKKLPGIGTTLDRAYSVIKVGKEALKGNTTGALKASVGVAGMYAGGAIGATLGSALGPVGTAVGGIVGSYIGEKLGDSVGGLIFNKTTEKLAKNTFNFAKNTAGKMFNFAKKTTGNVFNYGKKVLKNPKKLLDDYNNIKKKVVDKGISYIKNPKKLLKDAKDIGKKSMEFAKSALNKFNIFKKPKELVSKKLKSAKSYLMKNWDLSLPIADFKDISKQMLLSPFNLAGGLLGKAGKFATNTFNVGVMMEPSMKSNNKDNNISKNPKKLIKDKKSINDLGSKKINKVNLKVDKALETQKLDKKNILKTQTKEKKKTDNKYKNLDKKINLTKEEIKKALKEIESLNKKLKITKEIDISNLNANLLNDLALKLANIMAKNINYKLLNI
ncbi:MAG: hypothetical protein N4A54_00470 [Peptostreptococcaceae bacterium]|jgi:hypothetical protein|nr:hypothetical protein [Peptostreptococcaceae bacterium]